MSKQQGYIQIYVDDKEFAKITLTNKAEIEKLINNSEYCDEKYVFIKGEIITPKVVSKVTTFEID